MRLAAVSLCRAAGYAPQATLTRGYSRVTAFGAKGGKLDSIMDFAILNYNGVLFLTALTFPPKGVHC